MQTRLLINGQLVEGQGSPYAVYNPSEGSVVVKRFTPTTVVAPDSIRSPSWRAVTKPCVVAVLPWYVSSVMVSRSPRLARGSAWSFAGPLRHNARLLFRG